MQEVHIFLITSSHAPKLRKAWYRYILVCQGKTLEKKTDVQDVTGHQLVMECAVAALQRMIRPAMITIHTAIIWRMDMERWRYGNLMDGKGETVRSLRMQICGSSWRDFCSHMLSGSKLSPCFRILRQALLERNKEKQEMKRLQIVTS